MSSSSPSKSKRLSWKQTLEIGQHHKNSSTLTDTQRLESLILPKLQELGDRPHCINPKTNRPRKHPCHCLKLLGTSSEEENDNHDTDTSSMIMMIRRAVAKYILKFAKLKANEQVEQVAARLRPAAAMEQALKEALRSSSSNNESSSSSSQQIIIRRCFPIPFIVDDDDDDESTTSSAEMMVSKRLYTYTICQDALSELLRVNAHFLQHAKQVSYTTGTVRAHGLVGKRSNAATHFETVQRPLVEAFLEAHVLPTTTLVTHHNSKTGTTTQLRVLPEGSSKRKVYSQYAFTQGYVIATTATGAVSKTERTDADWISQQHNSHQPQAATVPSLSTFQQFWARQYPDVVAENVHDPTKKRGKLSSKKNNKRKRAV